MRKREREMRGRGNAAGGELEVLDVGLRGDVLVLAGGLPSWQRVEQG